MKLAIYLFFIAFLISLQINAYSVVMSSVPKPAETEIYIPDINHNDSDINILTGTSNSTLSANCITKLNRTLDIFSRFTSISKITNTGEMTNLMKLIKTSLDKLEAECHFEKAIVQQKLFNDLDCKGYIGEIEGLNNLILLNRNDEVGVMGLLKKIKELVNPGVEKCLTLNNEVSKDRNVQLILGKASVFKFKNQMNNNAGIDMSLYEPGINDNNSQPKLFVNNH